MKVFSLSSDPTSEERYQAVVELSVRGLSIFPVKDKKPLVPWIDYQTNPASPKQVVQWYRGHPGCGFALVTGRELAVVDLDTSEALAWAEDHLPQTPFRQTTPRGGQHWFYSAMPEGTTISAKAGIDIRNQGGYVVIAPTAGYAMTWDDSSGRYDFASLPVLAEIHMEWIAAYRGSAAAGPTEETSNEKKVHKGERNSTLTRWAGGMVHQGLRGPDLKYLLQKRNADCCDPPLSDDEVSRIASSMQRTDARNRTSDRPYLVSVAASTIQPQKVDWLWPSRIAMGKLSIIAGPPGKGKSQLTLDMAARISRGDAWPVDGRKAPLGTSLILSAEDDPHDTIVPRLIAAGADLNKVELLETVIEQGVEKTMNIERDMALLEEKLESIPDAKAVFIDPITAYLGHIDSHKNSDVRGALAPLSAVAQRCHVAIIAVSHLNKNERGSANDRVSGSIAFTAAARATYFVTEDKDDPSLRLFLSGKNNLAPDQDGLAFRITTIEEVPKIDWESNSVSVSADEALAPIDEHVRGKRQIAKEFLKESLQDGPVARSKITEAAANEDISAATLRRAKNELGVTAIKSGFEGGWEWVLPQAQKTKVLKPPVSEK